MRDTGGIALLLMFWVADAAMREFVLKLPKIFQPLAVCLLSNTSNISPPLGRQLEEDFKRRLVSAHKVFCGWKTNHCAEDISHFPRLKSVVLEEFKKRLKSWEGPNVFPVLDDDFLREWVCV